ncbi:C4-dicarboxylate TRAP transporter substrate-binding protein [Oceanicola sp. 502str15]|uniref:C4-dicarboxylate TRAP transporter substrate-binding protein n=1 Tax=Oceanicola sp. 502str15 TaxID=2696061 RepID=UPI002094D991|nr:C4-dicarboxylate TRAP transporter substrate-binding protein [Oceanicola sp. 502str15]MCO6385306.1 hypothetical protein [Oceanicola sp. 502str15]
MKKSKTSTLAAMSMLAMASVPASGENITLQYGAYGAPSSTLVEHGVIPFLETAKAESEGTLDYVLHAGGALVGASTTLAGIADGLVDGGQLLAVYHPSELPTINLAMGLGPSLTNDPVAVGAAITEFALLACPGCTKELEEWNIQFLGGYSSSPYALLCVEPYQSLDDLKGKRVRASGVWGQVAARLGMTPVNLTIGETYEGLQRGQLDCTFGSPNWLDSFSMGDVAPNLVKLDYGLSFSGPITNVSLDIWGRLTDEQKQALKDGAALSVVRASTAYVESDFAAIDRAEAEGWTIIEPDPEVLGAMDGFSDELAASVIERGVERGIENSEELIATFRELVVKWEKIVADAEGDEATIVEALKTEVYDKL